jgi:hypothetical protein
MIRSLVPLGLTFGIGLAHAGEPARSTSAADPAIGRVEIATIPFDPALRLRTATYTPSGKVLVAYANDGAEEERHVNLAVMDDDGKNLRPFFSQTLPPREKDNGIRFMIFADNRRIFLGDFIIECVPEIDTCDRASLYSVEYPAEVAGGDSISHRWSEIIVAPDNEHIAWTTLLSDYSAMVFTGKLKKEKTRYRILSPRIVSTLDAFKPDPKHPGAVIPGPVRNGEVKQFVKGGTAISLVGAKTRDTPDSVVQDLRTGDIEQVTHTPGYDETTIFSPDERLGITMSTRFSEATDMAILGLLPRPYPVSLNMGLSMYMYTHAVTGVRRSRSGNVGPALIDIERSKAGEGYRGINLSTQDEWVYHSPMSWHPDGRKAMWLEGRRDGETMRMQVVHLLDYEPGPPVAAKPTPDDIPYASTDLSAVERFFRQGKEMDVKVHGRHSGHIRYRRTAAGLIEKTYADFSDDGEHVYSGREQIQSSPHAYSTYTANVELSGPKPGVMDLKVTFGPLRGDSPAELVFAEDESGAPLTHGYAEYGGQRLGIDRLIP